MHFNFVVVSSTFQLNAPVSFTQRPVLAIERSSIHPPAVSPRSPPSPRRRTRGCEWASTRFREFKNGKEFLEKGREKRSR